MSNNPYASLPMEVNYEDERFKQIENEKNEQIASSTNTYDQMINNSNKFYQDQINASKEWADKQSEIQQQKTDFAVEKIEQQKDKTEKDYMKEQKAAYSDYMEQINPYGVNAEQMAASGLQNSGVSESSRISMWNTYQNRYATARESFNQAVLNYNNSIQEAILTNNEALAQIKYNALQQQLELSLQGFQYNNSLIQQKEAQLQNINNTYYSRYQDVLAQINAEVDRNREDYKWYENFSNTLKQQEEEHNKWKAEYELERQKMDQDHENWKKEFELKQQEYELNKQKTYASINSSNNNLLVEDELIDNSNIRSNVIKQVENTLNMVYSGAIRALSGKNKATELQKDTLSKLYENDQINKAEFIQLAQKYGF